MDAARIAVCVVEDNEVFREALEVLFSLTPDLDVLAAVPDGEAALEAFPALAPDVVLVDYRLPGLDGAAKRVYVCTRCLKGGKVKKAV